jgi:glycosyltransferase involved in cell wall biosynthesis
MQKLLYITPHLSTGGLPQYLTKKIELLKDEFDIYLIEWVDCTGGKLVVQRNKIKNLLPESKFYTLYEDKTELFSIINKIQPDIIHLEEIPEMFMDIKVAEFIYDPRRKYKIVETSHDSSYDTTQKTFYPDKFMFVSDWQINQYKDINIPSVLVEYPIEYVDRPDRIEALKKLGLDPEYKHVLHIGLFTPRKNQEEFFNYAKELQHEKIIFHCVGNQADNFKWYWEPLMQNKPENIVWWNERTDVENFYQAMDLFLFTSKGTKNDKETMPLVIREAISYQIPILIYNLPVYQNYFDKYKNINYLNFDDFKYNISKILIHLNLNTNYINPLDEAFIISTYPVTRAIIDTTKECILAAKKSSRKIILVSHIPIPKELSELVDYSINDNNNILTKHTFYSNSWLSTNEFKAHINLRGEDNDVYHGPACYSNYYNGVALAKGLNLKNVYLLNYDYILNEPLYINEISKILERYHAYFGKNEAAEGKQITTWFLGIEPNMFLEKLPYIESGKEYDKLMEKWGSESNGLENMFYHCFKGTRNVYWEDKEIFESKCNKAFIHKDYSRVEYFTILPLDSNRFVPFVQISNNNDSRRIEYTLIKNNNFVTTKYYDVTSRFHAWDIVNFEHEDIFEIKWEIYDSVNSNLLETKTIIVDNDYIKYKISNNGLFELLNKPKIKLIHLVTEPNINPKEIHSVKNIEDFCKQTGIKYQQNINTIWKELPPADSCNRPQDIQDKPGYYKLAPGHYGCYLAHKNALNDEDNINYDFVLIIEGDVIIDSNYQELYDSLTRFARISKEKDMDIIGFGNPWQDRNLNGGKYEDIFLDVTPFIPAQSYLITKDKINKIKTLLETTKWDAIDLWMCNVARLRIGTAEKIYTKHLPGYSIIEQTIKDANNDNPLIFTKNEDLPN